MAIAKRTNIRVWKDNFGDDYDDNDNGDDGCYYTHVIVLKLLYYT